MLNSTMISIPKGRVEAIICSYGTITLSYILWKVVDWIGLLKENKILRSSDLQFCFKEHASTTQCTFAMNEVIPYYNSKGSDVFIVSLDTTKAFNRIGFCKLFRKLLDRSVRPLLLWLLLYMHSLVGSIPGTKFGACNGVKQGVVLSRILFAVYMDDLYLQLKDSESGCHNGNHYADDTVLMAPSLKGLQTIVAISVNYARKHDYIYNGSKSQFLIFPSNLGSHVIYFKMSMRPFTLVIMSVSSIKFVCCNTPYHNSGVVSTYFERTFVAFTGDTMWFVHSILF